MKNGKQTVNKQEQIAARRQRTKEVIATFALEGIKLNKDTLAWFEIFDTSDMTADEAIEQLYAELNKRYNTNVKPPK